jgi:transcriptional regulator with XRE-family HTH domain
MDQDKRAELAAFLRTRRSRLRPEDLSIKTGSRRRAQGLRREEVAQAAGISTTWYVWLEQGRDVRASPHALRALGKALRLSGPEQAYLFQLARPDLDWRNHQPGPQPLSPSLHALLNGLAPHRAYALNRYWQVVACNRPAEVILGDFGNDEWAGSLMARIFLDPDWRERFVDWQAVARTAVAQFRLATAAMIDDPVLASLLSWLLSTSEEFARYWADRELAEPLIWQKAIRHPTAGILHFDFATLRPSGADGDFFLSVYTPANHETRRQLTSLLETCSRVD